jgi:hypothetical protein
MGESGDELCVFGFKRDTPIQITLTFPSGTESQWTLCDPCREGSDFIISPFMALPDYPIGLYHVRASQESVSAVGTFTLQRASKPTLAVRENCVDYFDGVPRGTVVHIGVSGFPYIQQAQLLLYYARTENGDAQFIASVPMVIDGAGDGLYVLPTQSDDPPGYYAVRTIPSIVENWINSLGPQHFCFRLK